MSLNHFSEIVIATGLSKGCHGITLRTYVAGLISMTTLWHPCRDQALQFKMCSEHQICINILSVAVKIVKAFPYVWPSVLGFTKLRIVY